MADSRSASGWRPLITAPERRAEIVRVIAEVVEATAAWSRADPVNSEELVDYATLRVYAASDDTVLDVDDEAGRALQTATERAGEMTSPALHGGTSRLLFALSHLSGGVDVELVCTTIEAGILRLLSTPAHHFDLISGLVGIAVPSLYRITDGNPSASSEAIVRVVIEHLETLSCPMSTGLAWLTPPSLLPVPQLRIAPLGYINLGLAHGVPGVIALLARCLVAGIEVIRTRKLLDGAVAYLRSVANSPPGSRYVPWVPTMRDEPQARIAWCYGDLGVAIALTSAAHATGRDDWLEDARELAYGMARRSFESSQVVDVGLCHGAAGVAHMFNRLAQATEDDELAAAADIWFRQALAMRSDAPLAGFPRASVDANGATISEASGDLLSGASGVALALHAAISAIEPAWDRLLLADLLPIARGAHVAESLEKPV